MTPKEKAKELVYKYQSLVNTWDCYNDESLEMIYRLPDMKQCALIAVDELIEYHNSLFNKGFKDVHIAISSPIKTYIDILNPQLKYLQEVKQEIEKL
jgi:hypothetical protein